MLPIPTLVLCNEYGTIKLADKPKCAVAIANNVVYMYYAYMLMKCNYALYRVIL